MKWLRFTAINDKLTSDVYKNNKIMTTKTEENKPNKTAISMKMANLLLKNETTNYANHSLSKYRINGTRNAEYVLRVLAWLLKKKHAHYIAVQQRCSVLQIINILFYENDAAN